MRRRHAGLIRAGIIRARLIRELLDGINLDPTTFGAIALATAVATLTRAETPALEQRAHLRTRLRERRRGRSTRPTNNTRSSGHRTNHKGAAMTTETQQKYEVTLFNTVEALLNEKHAAASWNYSTAADEVVDAVVAEGWVHESDVQAWLTEQYGEHASEAFADAFLPTIEGERI